MGAKRTTQAEADIAQAPRQRAASGAPRAAGGIERLQRQAGNRAVVELLRIGQARLDVGAADDPYEHEADAVAAQVVRTLRSGGAGAPASPDEDGPVRRIMRRAPVGAEGGALDQSTEAAINSARGGGSPLTDPVRSSMERAFGGADFSSVRLHSGSGAAALNRAVSAEAFTIGSDIFFSGAAPSTSSSAGQELLAHELTHTIQQGAASSARRRPASTGEPVLQRRWPFSKKEKPPPPSITPEQVNEVINAVNASPEMVAAEELRAQGKEDEALDKLDRYWETGKVTLKDGTELKLQEFKPLLFTPSERRMTKTKKWRLASAVRSMFDESVRKGQTAIPVKSGAPSVTAKDALGKHAATKGSTDGGAVASGFGGGGQATQVGDYGSNIAQHFEDPSKGAGMSFGAKLVDTKYNQAGDGLYSKPSMQSQSDWADGILGVIAQTFSFLSSVVLVIKQIGDEKSSKTDVAASTSDSLSQLTSVAGDILQVIEKAQGSELTTNVFHWVPGLSIFSNAFAAMKSAITLVPKAVQLHGIRSHGKKVTEAERDDLKRSIERLWVRSSQQVEADSFSIAKSLTNAGLAIAEVASAGGFGIPRLASAVVSGAGVVHNLGHTIADSLRAAATKTARTNYFGAHAKGSAEKLLRTDPSAAAEAIITRAFEGDAEAIAILKGFDIKLGKLGDGKMPGSERTVLRPSIPPKPAGLSRPGSAARPGRAAIEEDMFSYDHEATTTFDEAYTKLMGALSEDKDPKTIGDKIKGIFTKIKETPGQMRNRYRDAKRIADARNESNYKNKGNTSRGGGWAFKTAILGGDSAVAKASEDTARELRNSALPKADKEKLIGMLTPESIRQAKAKSDKEEAARPKVAITAPLDMAAKAQAEGLSFGALSSIIHGGKKASGLNDRAWETYMVVYTTRFAHPVGV